MVLFIFVQILLRFPCCFIWLHCPLLTPKSLLLATTSAAPPGHVVSWWLMVPHHHCSAQQVSGTGYSIVSSTPGISATAHAWAAASPAPWALAEPKPCSLTKRMSSSIYTQWHLGFKILRISRNSSFYFYLHVSPLPPPHRMQTSGQ